MLDAQGNYVCVLPDEPALLPSTAGGGAKNQSGTGSPVGVKTPDYVGQTYTNISGGFWQAIGLTNADWQQVA